MDLKLSEADQTFRDEVRDFLESNLTEDIRIERRDSHAIGQFEHIEVWHKKLYEKGWIAPGWPREHGGTGWNEVQRFIFANECWQRGAPMLAPFGITMCGPVLMAFGTEEQKQYFLPRILSMQDYWCQGYSEPGSGSDLASLKTRAEDKGDRYLVNGHKIWTTHAHHANRIFLLVRTDTATKPQAGISFLLVDMDSPGIRVEPIITLAGDHEVNQVFIDDVEVPKNRLVGKENEGWTVAKYLLSHERSGGNAAMVHQIVADIRFVATVEQTGDGRRLIEDTQFLRDLSTLEIDLLGVDMMERRIMSEFSQGGDPGAKSSILKARGTELMQRATMLNMELLGYYAIPDQKDARKPGSNIAVVGPDYAVAATAAYLNDRAASIYAGSNEVQRNIIAKMVLGL
ncbi:MAG: acyl-CoA dehydrogenase family protein [Pseudomonadales bacterium]|nr:acyl-CoA dehydrogenase family protein [Pseudomonadales bacterium]MDP7575860.1 acyl-CoA dehydrogenase family protein [Pseudomonadales bacterium]HJP49797.1 acyl-CoA dehydrogenase family protein [Pseudomonadales bacterium]